MGMPDACFPAWAIRGHLGTRHMVCPLQGPCVARGIPILLRCPVRTSQLAILLGLFLGFLLLYAHQMQIVGSHKRPPGLGFGWRSAAGRARPSGRPGHHTSGLDSLHLSVRPCGGAFDTDSRLSHRRFRFSCAYYPIAAAFRVHASTWYDVSRLSQLSRDSSWTRFVFAPVRYGTGSSPVYRELTDNSKCMNVSYRVEYCKFRRI
jgi:hypothetical protein